MYFNFSLIHLYLIILHFLTKMVCTSLLLEQEEIIIMKRVIENGPCCVIPRINGLSSKYFCCELFYTEMCIIKPICWTHWKIEYLPNPTLENVYSPFFSFLCSDLVRYCFWVFWNLSTLEGEKNHRRRNQKNRIYSL